MAEQTISSRLSVEDGAIIHPSSRQHPQHGGLTPVPDAVQASRPTRISVSGQIIKRPGEAGDIATSESYSLEDFGSEASVAFDSALTGYERHCAELLGEYRDYGYTADDLL